MQQESSVPAQSRWPRQVAWLLAVPLVLFGTLWLFVAQFDHAALGARLAARSLGRAVTVGSLRLSPGRWTRVELRDVRLANVPGGSRPEMATLAGATAEVELLSLLWGPLVLRRVETEGLRVLLERDGAGRGNWKGDGGGPPADPTGRSGFPDFREIRLADAEIELRTSSGKVLRTRFDAVRLRSDALGAPVRLEAEGRYNDMPAGLEADLGSVAELRDRARPFRTDLRLRAEDSRLHFDGTMTDPLHMDGADGRMLLEAPRLDTLLRLGGAAPMGLPSLRLDGRLQHEGDRWEASEASGALGDSRFTESDLRIVEGGRGAPDDVAARLRFDGLDLDALLGQRGGGPASDPSLAVDRSPDTLLAVDLSAQSVRYAGQRTGEAHLVATLTPGRLAVRTLSLAWLDGRITAEGALEAEDGSDSGRIRAEATATSLGTEALRRLFSLGTLPLSGQVDGRFLAAATGRTLNAALRAAQAAGVIRMEGGSVQRRLLELASTDLRTLFRAAEGNSRVTCVGAVLGLQGGVVTILPARLRAADGSVGGYGTVDLNRDRMDVLIASQAETTGALALDLPVRVSGPLGDPSAVPARWTAEGRAALLANGAVNRLPTELRNFARQSRCLRD